VRPHRAENGRRNARTGSRPTAVTHRRSQDRPPPSARITRPKGDEGYPPASQQGPGWDGGSASSRRLRKLWRRGCPPAATPPREVPLRPIPETGQWRGPLGSRWEATRAGSSKWFVASGLRRCTPGYPIPRPLHVGRVSAGLRRVASRSTATRKLFRPPTPA